MPFNPTQVAAMSTDEKECRFIALTNLGGYYGTATPNPNWDGPNEQDMENLWQIWLKGLLWPYSEYPSNHPPHVCSNWSLAVDGADNIGIAPTQTETNNQDAAGLVSRCLYSWPLPN